MAEAVVSQAKRSTRKYRVCAGRHIDDGDIMYDTGDVVESAHNLLHFNAPGMTPKFEAVSQDTPVTHKGNMWNPAAASPVFGSDLQPPAVITDPLTGVQRGTLDHMTLKELQAYAAEEEIDLRGATKKEDVLKIIHTAFGVQ